MRMHHIIFSNITLTTHIQLSAAGRYSSSQLQTAGSMFTGMLVMPLPQRLPSPAEHNFDCTCCGGSCSNLKPPEYLSCREAQSVCD